MELAQRRIPVQFAKRVVGRRMYGGQSTYIPLKINQAGVIAIIFASSVLFLPALLVQVVPWEPVQNFVNDYILDTTNWLHLLLYGLLIIGFSYFYNSIAFSPEKQADQLRKQGGFIPGIRPGPQTERYLAQGAEPAHPARCHLHRHHRPAAFDRARHRWRRTASRSAAPRC